MRVVAAGWQGGVGGVEGVVVFACVIYGAGLCALLYAYLLDGERVIPQAHRQQVRWC